MKYLFRMNEVFDNSGVIILQTGKVDERGLDGRNAFSGKISIIIS